MLSTVGIKNLPINETPIAVIDFETTGLTPGVDRVVEVSVYRMDPGKDACLAFDTLINPERRMSATEIHGIADEDVADAPTFSEITADFIESISGCVIASYNVYFDIKFLDYELNQTGVFHPLPHFCLMYMRPMLNLGKRCNLESACKYHNIDYKAAHIAANDAKVSAKLMECYFEVLNQKNIVTYGDLASLKSYKFINSFSETPLPDYKTFKLKKRERFLSRSSFQASITIDPERQAVNEYWDTLRMVVADLEITEDELSIVKQLRGKIRLPKEKIRMLHAKAFAAAIHQFINDSWLDDIETIKLRKLYKCLSILGWAPGE